MSKFTSNSSRKFSKLARLEIRDGTIGDEILCGVLRDGTEVMVVPERDRAARPGGYILMACGDMVPVMLGATRRSLPAAPAEPYRPGASRLRAQARGGQTETTIEAEVRRLLLAIGMRFTEKVADLPGTPDFFLPDVHTVLMAHGCYWHGHQCGNACPPHAATQHAEKIRRTTERDPAVLQRLLDLNLRVFVLWECAISGPRALTEAALREACEDFVTGCDRFRELPDRGDYPIT